MVSCHHLLHPKEANLEISSISDIHLEERYIQKRCKTEGDRSHVLQRIARTIGEQSTQVNLIAGDTADSVETFSLFVQQLSVFSKGDFFFVLGNHEYAGWSQEILLAPSNAKLAEIEQTYKVVIEQHGQQRMHLVQNNLFFLGKDWAWREITKAELANLSRDTVKDSIRMVFSGVNVGTFGQKTFPVWGPIIGF